MDYKSRMNREILQVKPSGIRKFFDIASEMNNVISLSIGEPDFTTPFHVRAEGIRTLEQGKTFYSPNRGFTALREEIVNWMERKYHVAYHPESEVLVTVGGSEAIDLAIRCLVNPGDELLIQQPSFVCYDPLTQMAEGHPVTSRKNYPKDQAVGAAIPKQPNRRRYAPQGFGGNCRGGTGA